MKAATATILCSLVLTGCGGQPSKPIADAVNDVCKNIAQATTTLKSDLRVHEGDSLKRIYAQSVTRFVIALSDAEQLLRNAKLSESNESDFRNAAIDSLSKTAETLRAAASEATSVEADPEKLAELKQQVSATMPEIPEHITKNAPNCLVKKANKLLATARSRQRPVLVQAEHQTFWLLRRARFWPTAKDRRLYLREL